MRDAGGLADHGIGIGNCGIDAVQTFLLPAVVVQEAPAACLDLLAVTVDQAAAAADAEYAAALQRRTGRAVAAARVGVGGGGFGGSEGCTRLLQIDFELRGAARVGGVPLLQCLGAGGEDGGALLPFAASIIPSQVF